MANGLYDPSSASAASDLHSLSEALLSACASQLISKVTRQAGPGAAAWLQLGLCNVAESLAGCEVTLELPSINGGQNGAIDAVAQHKQAAPSLQTPAASLPLTGTRNNPAASSESRASPSPRSSMTRMIFDAIDARNRRESDGFQLNDGALTPPHMGTISWRAGCACAVDFSPVCAADDMVQYPNRCYADCQASDRSAQVLTAAASVHTLQYVECLRSDACGRLLVAIIQS